LCLRGKKKKKVNKTALRKKQTKQKGGGKEEGEKKHAGRKGEKTLRGTGRKEARKVWTPGGGEAIKGLRPKGLFRVGTKKKKIQRGGKNVKGPRALHTKGKRHFCWENQRGVFLGKKQ